MKIAADVAGGFWVCLTSELSEVRFYADDEFLDQLEKLKGLLAHSHPNMSTGGLVAYLAQMGLEQLDPAEKKVREKKVWLLRRRTNRCVMKSGAGALPRRSFALFGKGMADVAFGRIRRPGRFVVPSTGFRWIIRYLGRWGASIPC